MKCAICLVKELLFPKQVKIEPSSFSSAFCTHVTNVKRASRLWLEISDKDLFKGLRICKLKTLADNTQSVLKETEKFESFIVKSTRLTNSVLHSQIGPE